MLDERTLASELQTREMLDVGCGISWQNLVRFAAVGSVILDQAERGRGSIQSSLAARPRIHLSSPLSEDDV